eukprot:SAG11_NODE_38490_length_252_cov_0.673203_1_plen_78_part_10
MRLLSAFGAAPAARGWEQAVELHLHDRRMVWLAGSDIEAFRQMLDDCGVAAFSSWEKELPKFGGDLRYKRLTIAQVMW